MIATNTTKVRELDMIKIGKLVIGREPVLLCSVVEPDVESTLREADIAFSAGADCLELRVDAIKTNNEVKEILGKIRKPALLVCRPTNLKGHFEGTEEERVNRLLFGIKNGAQAVDIEYTTDPELRKKVISAAKSKGIPVVICYENFEKTPTKDELLAILKDEESLGADIAKCAVLANSFNDLVRVLETINEAKKILKVPFVLIAMGVHGSASRALGPVMGTAMTYCCTAPEKDAGPGQLSVSETKAMITALQNKLGRG